MPNLQAQGLPTKNERAQSFIRVAGVWAQPGVCSLRCGRRQGPLHSVEPAVMHTQHRALCRPTPILSLPSQPRAAKGPRAQLAAGNVLSGIEGRFEIASSLTRMQRHDRDIVWLIPDTPQQGRGRGEHGQTWGCAAGQLDTSRDCVTLFLMVAVPTLHHPQLKRNETNFESPPPLVLRRWRIISGWKAAGIVVSGSVVRAAVW